MSIAWGSLGVVFVVSFGSAVAVVVLVTLAMVGLSARVPAAGDAVGQRSSMSAGAGTALAAVCLVAAAAITLYGLYIIVAA